MRIAVAQINTAVGDLKGNTQKIIASINQAEQKADLIVFPELTITGYPPRDLLLKKEFVGKNEEMHWLLWVHPLLPSGQVSLLFN